MGRRGPRVLVDDPVLRAVHPRDGLRLTRDSDVLARVQRAAEFAGVAVILLSWLWIGDLLAAAQGLRGILLTQVLLVLLPTALFAARYGGVRAELGLRRASVLRLLGAIGLGLAMSIVTSGLAQWQERWIHPHPLEVEAMTRLATAVAATPFQAAVSLALAPAVAEEALFRGLLLGRLRRRFGASRAVAVTAIGFALIHRSPMRLMAPLMLGAVLGMVTVSSGSTIPAMVLHLTYNLAILGFSAGWAPEPAEPAWFVLAAAAAIVLLILESRHNA